MEFTLFGKPIEISEGRKNYMNILTYYKAMAEEAEKDFKKEYENTFGTVFLNSTYAERFQRTYGNDDYMDKIVKRYVARTRQYLTNYGVYDLTDSEIWKEAIVDDDRSVSRLQYNFNAFMDTALYDSNWDFVTDDVLVSRIKSKFDSSVFPSYLRIDIMALCDYVINYLSENHIVEIQFVYEKDVTKAEAYYRNLLDTIVTEDDEIKLLESTFGLDNDKADAILQRGVQKSNILDSTKEQLAYELIELDPRSKLYYEYIFENFSQAKYEIAAIAQYLYIDLSVLIEKDIKRSFDLKAISTEADAMNMMADLQDAMKKYNVTKSSRKEELEKILRDFDIKARTYDNVLYDTRELRAQAENDDLILDNLHGNVCDIGKAACNNFLTEIAHMQCTPAIKNKHLQLLNDRIAFIDNEKLECLLTGLDGQNESECNLVKEEVEQYDAPENTKAPFLARIEKRIYAIWDEEDFARFSEIYAQTQVSNSEQVGANCALIQNTGRTETKDRFIKALYFLNESEVEAAAKYAIAKESGMFASLLNMGKKETYEILTLNGSVMHPAILAAMEVAKEKKNSGFFSSFKKNKTASQAAQTLGMAKFCSACGAKIDGASKFCSNCGNKIG